MRINLIGQRFGKLRVKALHSITKSGSLWVCDCDCGGERTDTTSHIKGSANIGCKACEFTNRSAAKGKHWGRNTKLYQVWKGIHSRCRDSGNTSFPYYGGKGIRVCSEWKDYPAFKEWASSHDYTDGLSIDRIDPKLNYAPENCEWVTRAENSKRAHRKAA